MTSVGRAKMRAVAIEINWLLFLCVAPSHSYNSFDWTSCVHSTAETEVGRLSSLDFPHISFGTLPEKPRRPKSSQAGGEKRRVSRLHRYPYHRLVITLNMNLYLHSNSQPFFTL